MTAIGPTKGKERITFLDALRGFALVGILFANILSWSGLKFMPLSEMSQLGNFDLDLLLRDLLKFFVDTKFYTIFSLLFGVGFYVQFSRKGDDPGFAPVYRKRLFILLIMGAAHALIWSGDILTLYALVGMLFFALRHLSSRSMWVLAAVSLSMPVLLDVIYMLTFSSSIEPLPKTAWTVYSDMSPEEVVAGFESVNPLTVLMQNLHNLYWRWMDFIPSSRPFKVLGFFVLGSQLFRSGFFTEHARKWRVLLPLLVLGIGFTCLKMALGGSVSSFSKDWGDVLAKLTHEIGQITLALSYVCILARVYEFLQHIRLFEWLRMYGRMSLTSYVGHTVIGIVIFYPVIGFGYFAKLSLAQVFLVAASILSIQVLFSVLWLKWFAFGPLEWLWRCATYGQWFPLKRRAKAN